MPLVFETARPSAHPAPQRTDITCFVGYVKRRDGSLPEPVRESLRVAGWVEGAWARDADAVRALEQLPVAVESWDAFDQLFDWRSRPVSANGTATCASYMGAAVRRFFSQGGQRAVVVRVGDPWPYLDDVGGRAAARRARLRRLVPDVEPAVAGHRLFDPTDPRQWLGVEHVYGLPEVSLVSLPDLADACASEPAPPAVGLPQVPLTEGFVECSESEASLPDDLGLRRLQAPRCDAEGLSAWAEAIGGARRLLFRHRRDAVLVGALPLMTAAAAQRDPLDYLQRERILEAMGGEPARVSSAFVQLAYPWVSARSSDDLPQGIEPPDGLLAGLLAAGAIARGTYRSVAGSLLPAVVATEPVLSWGLGIGTAAARLGERLCVIARQPDGWALQSDVTTSPNLSWRAGGVTRMMASLVRAARTTGEAELFGANGPVLWTRVERQMEALLTAYWQEGGLGGASPDEAFDVRCDRSTMTQNDLDAGRLIVHITVLPVAAVERITLVLSLSAAGQLTGEIREVA